MPPILKGFLTTAIPGIIAVVLLALLLAGRGGAEQVSKYPGAKVDSWNFPGADGGYYLDNFTMPNGHKLVCVEYDSYMECNWDAFNKEVNR